MSQKTFHHRSHHLLTAICVVLSVLLISWAPVPAFAADPESTTSGTETTTTPSGTSAGTTTTEGGTTEGSGGGTDEWDTDVLNSPLTLPGLPLWKAFQDLLSFSISGDAAGQD